MSSRSSDLEWRRPVRCDIETAVVDVGGDADAMILVRNGAQPAEVPLVLTHEEWATFLDGVKAGEFDV